HARHGRHATFAPPGGKSPSHGALRYGKNHRFRGSSRHGVRPLHLRARKFHGTGDGLCAPVYRAEQEQFGGRQSQASDPNRSRAIAARWISFRARAARPGLRQRRRTRRRQGLSRKENGPIQRKVIIWIILTKLSMEVS